MEDRLGFVVEDLLHGNAPVVVRSAKFAVDEGIVKTSGCGLGRRGCIENSRRTRPIDGAKTHRTGLASGKELAVIELEGFKALAGFTNGDDFCVSGGIVRGGDAVCTSGN